MDNWSIEYRYTADTAGRDQHRPAHRAFLQTLLADGSLVAFGRYEDDDPDGALLLGRAASKADMAAIIGADPFAQQGLIAAVTIRRWIPTWRADGLPTG